MKNNICQKEVDVISFEIKSSNALPVNFILFDPYSIVGQSSNMVVTIPTTGKGTYSGVVSTASLSRYVIGCPMYVSSLQVEFNPNFNLPIPTTPVKIPNVIIAKAGIDGRSTRCSTISGSTKRNTQFQSNLQTYEKDFKIDSHTGLIVTLEQFNSMIITLYIEKIGQ
jgi:hypothetical protein